MVCFWSFPPRRYLPSFPTRRSSDLDHSGDISSAADVSLGSWLPDRVLHIHSYSKSHGRSEEHTSELQSRPQLVCRLLLDKKKRPITGTISPDDGMGRCRSFPPGC